MNEHNLDTYLRNRLQKSKEEAPELVSLRVNQTLQSLQKKVGWVRRVSFGAVAVCLVFGCLTITSSVFPGMAQALKNVPVLGSVFEIIGDEGSRLSSLAGLSSKVNITDEDQGIIMTISEVLYDGVRISIGYYMETTNDVRPNQMDIYVNGKRLNASVGESGREVGSHLFAGIIDYNLTEKLPDHFNLKIHYLTMNDYTQMSENLPKEIKGSWNFNLPVTKLTQGITTKTFAKEPQVNNEGKMISVKKVIFTPVVTAIQLDAFEPITANENLTKGQEKKQFVQKGYQVLDDRGIILENLGSSSHSSTKDGDTTRKTEEQIILAPVTRTPKYLIIRPVAITHSTDPVIKPVFIKAKLNEAQFPLTLSQGETGKLTVTNVEFFEDKTLLYYQVEGEDPYRQADAVYIESESGQRYGKITRQSKRMDGLASKFMMTFPHFDKIQQLYVVTSNLERLITTKELELKIPIEE